MINIFQIIFVISFLFSIESPSDQYLNSIDVDNKLGTKLTGTIEVIDENNNTITLNEVFKDKPTVLVMAYYQCPMLCSMVLNGLSDAINESDLIPGEDYEVLTVSIDPSEKNNLSHLSNIFGQFFSLTLALFIKTKPGLKHKIVESM